ncbi:hypothetical protein ILYODFUR_012994 [Ilyodon furcidens]|uniref:Secreted protein n=1 Tax=Ilyodon furcidens TaxID=33524 RepID=A0ABV0T8W9_9TELE
MAPWTAATRVFLGSLLKVWQLSVGFTGNADEGNAEVSSSSSDSALPMPCFQLFQADRSAELSDKKRGGGICFYLNEGGVLLLNSCPCSHPTRILRIRGWPNLHS